MVDSGRARSDRSIAMAAAVSSARLALPRLAAEPQADLRASVGALILDFR